MSKEPTHRHKKTGALVFPEGYKASEIEPASKEFIASVQSTETLQRIKLEARTEILAIASIEKQLNDIRAWLDRLGLDNTDADARSRFAAIDAIRARSNKDEEAVKPKE